MTRYEVIPGYTGSEIERASMTSYTDLQESAVERMIKKQIAKGLAQLASYIAPSDVGVYEVRELKERCC